MNDNQKIQYIEKIYQKLSEKSKSCTLCPRNCHINRLNNELGYCGQGKKIKIYSSFLHFGEEPPISGKRGSGTIFFSGCSLHCAYCQNYKFSQQSKGEIIEEEGLARIMVDLARKNAENINLVTPAHFLPQILKALKISWEKGLKLPIVYNGSGYEQKEIVEAIEPIIDSWLIDFKYISSETAKNYSNSPRYPHLVKNTLSYLYKQKNGQNKLNKGQIPPIIIRHLILPGHIDETRRILTWIKKNAPEAWISVMSQYQPYFKAKEFAKINRTLNLKEYNQIKKLVEALGLKGWLQEFKPQENLAGVHFKKDKKEL
jgi:putative pyruvate formate lyase activating enzyme